ncbi:MAG: glycoside hydrolase family 97 catalytic domain-containing protein [Prevotella sp.]|nr:glycoside hydrolase family 97 catalytic domain-containing protein [Prevotella sp.]
MSMKKFFLWLAVASLTMTATAQRLTSPNGKLSVKSENGQWVIDYQGQQVLTMKAAEAATSLKDMKPQFVKADYQMLSGKRSHCTNEANEYRIGQMTLRLYNDGLAYRYESSVKEQAAYVIPEGMKRWMMQWTDGAENFYPLMTSYKEKAQRSFSAVSKDADGNCVRWSFPALLELKDGVFALLTEANIEKGQSASSMYNEGEVYRVVEDEKIPGGITAGHSPWRVVIIGTLGDVVESTLVTDVSEPCKLEDTSWIHPGVVSWVYWAYNHGSDDYNIIKKYTDLAATLRLPYVLIDAEWDRMKDGKTVEDAVAYAKSRGVKPMIWYNSSVGWIDGAPTPKFRLNKPEDREKEFAWCEKIGVAGVKIDFFSGENQKNMDYCIDLMESAARHHLLVNFHGATVPRGWQRTYPNLLSTEGVYGAEWYNNVPTFTDKAASHNATLPFTRNVIGPMDYTPCAFSDSQHPHITSHAHELALTALFESGLQHLADRPESFLAQPQAVQDFLSDLPAAWDETRFVSGYPGESCVLARRSGKTWYVAGINGTDSEKTLAVPLDFIKGKHTATLFADSGSKEQPWRIESVKKLPATVTCQPRGGFIFVIK